VGVLAALTTTQVKRIADSLGQRDSRTGRLDRQNGAVVDTAESSALRILLQGIVGCGAAAGGATGAGGGSCASGGGGASAAVVLNMLVAGIDKQDRIDTSGDGSPDAYTLETQQARTALITTLTGILAGTLGGNAGTAAYAAQVETENNSLYTLPDGRVTRTCAGRDVKNCATVASLMLLERGSVGRTRLDEVITAYNLSFLSDKSPLLVTLLEGVVGLQQRNVPATQIKEAVDFLIEKFADSPSSLDSAIKAIQAGKTITEYKADYYRRVESSRAVLSESTLAAITLQLIFTSPGQSEIDAAKFTIGQSENILSQIAKQTRELRLEDVFSNGSSLGLQVRLSPHFQAYVLYSAQRNPQALLDFDRANPGFIEQMVGRGVGFNETLLPAIAGYRSGRITTDNFNDAVVRSSYAYVKYNAGEAASATGETAFNLLSMAGFENGRIVGGPAPRSLAIGRSGLPTSVELAFDQVKSRTQFEAQMLLQASADIGGLRAQLTSDAARSGNVAVAEVTITGLSSTRFAAHSRISTPTAQFVGNGAGIFTYLSLPARGGIKPIDRDIDSEYKILDNIAGQLGDNRAASGRVNLISERPPCPSCQGVIQQFQARYPNVYVFVTYLGRNVRPTRTTPPTRPEIPRRSN
jgi:The  BURPS668_1122 family of deaminases